LLYSLLALYRPARLLACIATITIVVPFYMFEVYLHMGSSKASFTQELRAQGIEAYPRISPNELMDLWLSTGDENPIRVEGSEVLPLAGIPDSATVYCQADDGGMIVYQSDRLGFRNVERTSATEPPEFALLGDSFVHGYCVRDEDTYAAQLGILGSTRNFGIDGTSVLAQLAIYTEYVQHLRAQHLVWFFYAGNDLHGFVAERERPPLQAYFTPSHSQDLMTLNDSIAGATKRYIDEQLMLRVGRARLDEEKPFGNVILDFLFLRKARGALLGANVRKLGQVSQDEIPPRVSGAEWREIMGIWGRVIDRQRKHGGDITFVYIPSVNRFATSDPAIHLDVERTVRGIWGELGVEHVSFTDVLLTVKDPLSLYSGIHFTKQGYEVTADYLIDQLKRATGRSRKHARRDFEARDVTDPSPDQAHEIACSIAHPDPRVRVNRRTAGGSAGPGAVASIPSSCISPEFTSGEKSLQVHQYQRERPDRRETLSAS
jgi:hypothetical protein